jgi:hypothetical protein
MNEHTHTLTFAEHSLTTKHHVRLEDMEILANEDHFYKCQIREAVEIMKHPNNLNRDNDLEIIQN